MSAIAQTPDGKTVDWAEMRSLHVKGLSLLELSRQTGVNYNTIKSRSASEHWAKSVAKAKLHVASHTTQTLTDRATLWVNRVDKFIHKAFNSLESKEMDKIGLRELERALDCADRANRIARSNYGLDSEPHSNRQPVAVQVNISGTHASALLNSSLDSESVIDADLVERPKLEAPKSSTPN